MIKLNGGRCGRQADVSFSGYRRHAGTVIRFT
jgi:hypothetical protein